MEGLHNMQWYDWMRLATAAVSLAVMFRLAWNIRNRRLIGQRYSEILKDFIWVMFAYLFTQMVGALETLAQDAPYRWGALLSFIISLVALRATRKNIDPLIV